MHGSSKVVPPAEAHPRGSEAWIKLQREAVRTGKSRRTIEDLHIPPRYASMSLANFEGAEDLKLEARQTLGNRSVFLWGPCGTGKTHLAVGLLRDRCADLMSYPDPDVYVNVWKRPP